MGYERFEPGLLTAKLAQQLIFKHALTVSLPLVLAPNVKTRADWGLIPEGKVLSFSVAIYYMYVSIRSGLIHKQVGGSSVEGCCNDILKLYIFLTQWNSHSA